MKSVWYLGFSDNRVRIPYVAPLLSWWSYWILVLPIHSQMGSHALSLGTCGTIALMKQLTLLLGLLPLALNSPLISISLRRSCRPQSVKVFQQVCHVLLPSLAAITASPVINVLEKWQKKIDETRCEVNELPSEQSKNCLLLTYCFTSRLQKSSDKTIF